MVWSEETILLLRELWAQGHSTAEIGRRLGVTKNAIVGKAHRLDLTARPSPIRRDGSSAPADRPQALCRVEGPTLPPLASAIAQPASPAPASSYNVQPIRPAPALNVSPGQTGVPRSFAPPVAVSPPPRPVAPSAPMQQRRSAPSCCWPIGEPGKRDFRFCDDPSMAGKPYCAEHAKLAYVKIRDRKEDAA
jgi:GcrA cell cycle regulator